MLSEIRIGRLLSSRGHYTRYGPCKLRSIHDPLQQRMLTLFFEQVVGSEMLIDDYDMDEKQDVAIITPAESSEEAEAEPAADDCG